MCLPRDGLDSAFFRVENHPGFRYAISDFDNEADFVQDRLGVGCLHVRPHFCVTVERREMALVEVGSELVEIWID